jgi:hypothetical protein
MKDDRDRIPGTLDVISVNSMALLLPILGVLVLAVCLVVYAVTGDEYWTIHTLSYIVTMGSVVFVAGSVHLFRRVRRIQYLFRYGLPCSARVVRISADGTWNLGRFRVRTNVLRWCLYEYEVDGRIYRCRTWFEIPALNQPLSPDDVVTVLLDPHRPAVSVLMLLYEA